MITLTETAIEKIAEVLAEEPNPNATLRIFVQGGGCSGMSYGFAVEDQKNEDDFEIPAGSRTILVDSISLQYVTGATVDFVEELMGASFKISNPNAQTTCGCGSSFSPY